MSGKTITVSCKTCRNPFTARVADRKRGWARFCSKSCKARWQESRTGQYRRYLKCKQIADDGHIVECDFGDDCET